MEIFNVHYGELSLKGKNKASFENRLKYNIETALDGIEYEKIERKETRIIIYLNEKSNKEEIEKKLNKVFGISWFSFAYVIEKDLEKVTKLILDYAKEHLNGKKVKIDTKRSDKKFQATSLDVNKKIGKELEANGIEIDLKKPEKKIFVEILNDKIIVSFEKIKGLGGMPVKSSGKILSLFSGGIDSPVSSWLMMKRGCEVNFLHIHNYPRNDDVLNSKIVKLIKILKEFHPYKISLYIVSYQDFQEKTFEVPPKLELVLFRRFIANVANKLCKEEGALGVVTGDSIAQVASQTLENLYCVDEAFSVPVYRPLATYDKQEIMELAQKIGTFDASIEEYKDCCSLVAVKHPATKARLEQIKMIEERIGIEEVVRKTLEKIKVVEI